MFLRLAKTRAVVELVELGVALAAAAVEAVHVLVVVEAVHVVVAVEIAMAVAIEITVVDNSSKNESFFSTLI
jgi:hypothetical protein